jgi:2-iminobutanoate/2-iminopropanoate deaminase
MTMEKIATEEAPRAIGPYSQAVRAAGLVFLSGQIALDPETGKLEGGGIRAEAERVMQNLAAVLLAAGLSFDHVVKTTIYLVDFADFETVNEIYGKRFSKVLPARATVQVSALPRGARVEIDAIASTPGLP